MSNIVMVQCIKSAKTKLFVLFTCCFFFAFFTFCFCVSKLSKFQNIYFFENLLFE